MTLALGPVAIVGLLVGSLVSKYDVEVASAEAVDFASEVCIVAGTILIVMSILNLGNFIRFISHPVMSGFTTAAAMLIGLNQIKGAFGFKTVDGYYPQTGDGLIHYNYEVMQWLAAHFYDTYVFCYIGLPFFPLRDVSVSPLSIYCCLFVFSDMT
jgi:MFS superfamily sulfate permease-like transporter